MNIEINHQAIKKIEAIHSISNVKNDKRRRTLLIKKKDSNKLISFKDILEEKLKQR